MNTININIMGYLSPDAYSYLNVTIFLGGYESFNIKLWTAEIVSTSDIPISPKAVNIININTMGYLSSDAYTCLKVTIFLGGY